MKVIQLQECMASTMSANVGITSLYGEISARCSTTCLFQQLLMREYYVCMEVFPLNFSHSIKLTKFKGHKKYQIQDYSVIFFGQTPMQILTAGMKMRGE